MVMKIEKNNPIYLINSDEFNEQITFNSINEALAYLCSDNKSRVQVLYSNLSLPSEKDSPFTKDCLVKLDFKFENKKYNFYFKSIDGNITFTNKVFKATSVTRDFARKLIIYFELILGSSNQNIKFSICLKDAIYEMVPKYDEISKENKHLKNELNSKDLKLQESQERLSKFNDESEQQKKVLNKRNEDYRTLNHEYNELKKNYELLKVENHKLLNSNDHRNAEDLKKKNKQLMLKYQKFYCDKDCDECNVLNKIFEFYKCDFSQFKKINCSRLSLDEKNNWFPYNKIENNFNYFQRYQDDYNHANLYFFNTIFKHLINKTSKRSFKIAIIGGGNGSELFALNEVGKSNLINFDCTFVDKVIWPANYFYKEYRHISDLTIKKMDYNKFIDEKIKYDVVIFNRILNYKDLPDNIKIDNSLIDKYLTDQISKINTINSSYTFLIQVIPKSQNEGRTDLVEAIISKNELVHLSRGTHNNDHFEHKLYIIRKMNTSIMSERKK